MEPVPRGSPAATRLRELQAEVEQLREAVSSHAVVDQAIGMVIALARVSPDQGWAVLKEVSQHTNVKLRDVAEQVLVWGRTGQLAEEVRSALADAVDRHAPAQVPGAPAAG
ncbi:ANTAR domain-containing protein [Streptomyces longwoodensis]|uniref:ANTAR domain-containing protein n=1 Tax=Streptomyces longwoodensis TaxID=68231 RepID=UPI0033E227F1